MRANKDTSMMVEDPTVGTQVIELKKDDQFLLPFRALKILKDVKKAAKISKSNTNLATITYETINYLEGLKHYNELREIT